MLGHFFAGFTLDTYARVTTSAQKEAAQTTGNNLALCSAKKRTALSYDRAVQNIWSSAV